MEIGQIFLNIGKGVVAGLAYGIAGFFKRKKDEPFDWTKFLSTLGISAVAGGVLGFQNLPISEGYDTTLIMLETIGITYIIQALAKLVWRRWLKKLIDKIKGNTGEYLEV